MAIPDPSFAALRRQIHDALRSQHPDWIGSDGNSPICDEYERRFEQTLTQIIAPRKRTVHRTPSRKIHLFTSVFSSRKSTSAKHDEHETARAA